MKNAVLPAPTVANGEVFWGIRPEHLNLVADDDDGAIEIRVTAVETTGHATLVSGEAGQLILTALFTDRANIVRGAEIHLKPRADRQHFFGAESGARLD